MTSTIHEQNFADEVLQLAENPSASTAWLSGPLKARLKRFMKRNNLMAQREKYQDRNRRESINELFGKVGGIAAFGVGAATGVGLPISALIALWANNAYRQSGKSITEFQARRKEKLKTSLELLKKLEARKAEATSNPAKALTPVEDVQYHAAVLETKRLSEFSRARELLDGMVAVFPLTAGLKAIGHNIKATYKNMSPNTKFVKTEGITARNIKRAARVLPVVGLGTLYKSVSGIAFSAGNVVHSATMAIKAVPKIYDWEKVKLAKIQDKGAAWVADKFDGFMKGKWLTKAKDAMTKLSQWPSARESKGANMAMAPS